jgi:hypothetical protein
MSIRVVLSCNGKEGMYDCRQATPVGEVMSAREARAIAKKTHGWSSTLAAFSREDSVLDFCPACTKRMQER